MAPGPTRWGRMPPARPEGRSASHHLPKGPVCYTRSPEGETRVTLTADGRWLFAARALRRAIGRRPSASPLFLPPGTGCSIPAPWGGDEMRSGLLALLVASSPTAWAQAPSPAASGTEVVVLKAARMFDGRGDSTVPNAVVIVESGRITAAGSGLAVPAGARVIDLGDATLLPGFIDAHVHLTGESADDWYRAAVEGLRRPVAEKAIRSTEFARRTLMAGFTTVRNVGAEDYIDVGLRNSINAGVVAGPRMLVATQALGARGGHCGTTRVPYLPFRKEPGG